MSVEIENNIIARLTDTLTSLAIQKEKFRTSEDRARHLNKIIDDLRRDNRYLEDKLIERTQRAEDAEAALWSLKSKMAALEESHAYLVAKISG